MVLGVDGCRQGWVAAIIEEHRPIRLERFDDLSSLWAQYGHPCRLMLVDIPIGLIAEGAEGRECDRHARRLLSPLRHSSIFTPPCRSALYAGDPSEINFQLTGKKLSRQTINILPKIRETDLWLRSLPQWERAIIKESHPELVFATLNGGRPLLNNKKKASGRTERIDLLQRYLPEAAAILAEARSHIPAKAAQPDDLTDALVLALAAKRAAERPELARSLPDDPSLDKEGLPMQIFYSA